MQIIREQVRFNSLISGGTTNLKFSLGATENFIGYQEEIDNLTQVVSLDLVNPVNDVEVRRFRFFDGVNLAPVIKFSFYSILIIGLSNFSQYFVPPTFVIGSNMFTPLEVSGNSDNFLDSFFILDFFDSFDINNQTKIFTTYLTKKGTVPTYTIGSVNQLYYWYVPLSFINAQTGSTATGYVKLSFYNAKTGKLVLFYNEDNNVPIIRDTPQRMFFKAELNLNNKTWKFITPSYPTIKAKEFISSVSFVDKANGTVNTIDDLQQNPPSGNTFTYTTGAATYLTT